MRSWYVPLSLAAVLVLSVGVTLRIQHEQPDPQPPLAAAKPGPAVTEARPAAPAPGFVPDPDAVKRAAPAAGEDRPAPGRLAEAAPARPAAAPQAADVAAQADAASAPRAAVGAMQGAREPAARERQEFATAPPAPAMPLPPPPAKAAAPPPPAKPVALEPPERWLERIVALRREGRQAEADASFAEFRKRHPDYRIAQEMLEKVQPR
jgi:hypothetical protein